MGFFFACVLRDRHHRFVRDEFDEYQEPTIGAAFLSQSVRTSSDRVVKFEIWDTAGQERYHSLAPMYYRDAAVALVVYDITNGDSLVTAQKWVRELRMKGREDCMIAFMGNKADLESQRAVPTAEAAQWAAENGCLHAEASAKTGMGVVELFQSVADKLPEPKAEEDKRSFPILPEPEPAKSSGCC